LSVKKINPDLIIMVRIEDPVHVEKLCRLLFQAGVDIIHLGA
jgi:2-keto-3-deoxy-L-rhamnonate aldolase RhmA